MSSTRVGTGENAMADGEQGSNTDRNGATPTEGSADRVIDVTTLRLEELRQSRHSLESEEKELSYVRRLLQGRIDIIKAELARRAGHGNDVLSSLPAILADAPSSFKSSARHVSLDEPVTKHATAIAAKRAANDLSMNLADVSDPQLRTMLDNLARHEKAVSKARSQLHKTMDGLNSELTRRYREGSAQVDDLLAAARRK